MLASKQQQQQQQQRPHVSSRTWLHTALAAAVAALALFILFVVLVNPRNPATERSILLDSGYTAACQSSAGTGVALCAALGSSGDTSSRKVLPIAGVAAYSLVAIGAYRRGPSVWDVLILAGGLVAKDDDPGAYGCRWYPAHPAPATTPDSVASLLTVKASSVVKPGVAYRLTYTPVVITCQFSSPVGVDGLGGGIVLLYNDSGHNVGGTGYAAGSQVKEEDEWMVHQVYGAGNDAYDKGDGKCSQSGGVGELQTLAGTERPETYNASKFQAPPTYQHLYCGSPLYGNLNGQALHEWISFHFHQFGNRSHFVFHDVGGISQDARRLLAPWIDFGILQIEDVRYLNQFDGYYHNQYLILNECLLKARHLAEWVWFFDVDEYLVVKPPFATINALVDKYRDRGQLQFPQHLFSSNLCPVTSPTFREEKWTVETLLFAVKGGSTFKKYKWAANPRKVSAASVHFAMTSGKPSKWIVDSSEASYFHYHNTVDRKQVDLCQRRVKEEEYKNLSQHFRSGLEYLQYDASILPLAHQAKLQSAQYLNRNGL